MSRRSLATLAAVVLTGALAAPAAAGPQLRGVQLHSLWSGVSPAAMQRELDLAADAGSTVVRLDVVWGSLETDGRGRIEASYRERLDRFVAGAAARGMKVIATLWSTPCWASTAPPEVKQGCRGAWWDRDVGAYPPSRARDYAAVARWLTARYGTRLAALELWNEPNNDTTDHFWRARDRAGAYARLVRAAYPAAKRGHPRVPVIVGSLAFADRPFLERLYALGLARFSDGISVHPYNEWRAPEDQWQPQWRKYTFGPGLQWIRDAMVAAGDRDRIWVTEFGWSTGRGDRWSVTARQQADYIRGAFRVLANLDYVAAATVYSLVAKTDDPWSLEGGFGLVTSNYVPKPAYGALVAALGGPRR